MSAINHTEESQTLDIQNMAEIYQQGYLLAAKHTLIWGVPEHEESDCSDDDGAMHVTAWAKPERNDSNCRNDNSDRHTLTWADSDEGKSLCGGNGGVKKVLTWGELKGLESNCPNDGEATIMLTCGEPEHEHSYCSEEGWETHMVIWGVPDNDDSSDDSSDEGILVEIDTPQDKNVGQYGVAFRILRATGFRRSAKKTKPTRLSPRDVEFAELCKIENVRDYNLALRKYENGLKAGCTHMELLEVLRTIRCRRA